MASVYTDVFSYSDVETVYTGLTNGIKDTTNSRKLRAMRNTRVHVWNIMNGIKWINKIKSCESKDTDEKILKHMLKSPYKTISVLANETLQT
jgi:hypothetical protein